MTDFRKRESFAWAKLLPTLNSWDAGKKKRARVLAKCISITVEVQSNHFSRDLICKSFFFSDPLNRYPRETMELVEELAFGVVQEYREQQKGRLKRTFVSGADAAGAKVNRGKAKTS